MSHILKRCLSAIALVALTAPPATAGDDVNTGDRFLTGTRQLTYSGLRAGEGYFSADGRRIIFQSERDKDNPFYQIFVLDLETGDTHRVSPGHGKTTCAFFHPDGDRVLYASTHLDPDAVQKQTDEIEFRESGKQRRYSWDYDKHFDIFAADASGENTVRLTDAEGYDAEGAYSPDGTKIVFCSMRDAYPASKLSKEQQELLKVDTAYFGEIYIMDADGSNQTRLTDWPGYDGGPFFTPDGERIVWRHFSEDGMTADVYTMKLDGSDRKQLTDFGSMCWAPYFHPSGEYAIFTTNKQGFSNFELYIVDDDGKKEPVRVTHTDGFDGLPVFSPDGNSLMWTSNRTRNEKSQLFLASWDHAAALDALAAAPPRGESQAEESADPHHHGSVTRYASEAVAGYSAQKDDPHQETEHQPAGVPFAPEITAAELRSMVNFLASDALEGRLTGTEGETRAGEYIAAFLTSIGATPMGDDGTYFQRFPFTSGVTVVEGGNRMVITSDDLISTLEVEKDFQPLAFSDDDTVEGEVVFAGYGLDAPGDMETGYDSYAGLDVKDKIVLVLRYAPEDVDMERRQQLNMYAGLRYKAMIARENGAKALLVAIGPNSPNAGELVPLKFDQSLASSGIPVVSVSGDVANALFANAETSLQEAQDGLDMENPHVPGHFALPVATVKLTTKIERETDYGRNVIGYIPPGSNTGDEPVLVIGGHYDHIGKGAIGSLAEGDARTMVHNGADDNASGTSTVLEIAAALAHARDENPEAFEYGVLIALWSGEEMGIIGSNYYAENPTVEFARIAAYMNFDMVGRLRENKLMVQGIGSAPGWIGMVESRNVPIGFTLEVNEDPYLPTDVTAFYPKKVPVISFFTGSHDDYNKPTDDPATLNYDGMERIGRYAAAIAMDVVGGTADLEYVQVERSQEQMGGRAALRAYLGTIPDYAGGDIEGVKLSGVRGGGPAEKAGLKGGDVIVVFGGKEIKNIYDYTYALDAVKIGEMVEVVVLRDGQRVTLTVIPEARK